MTNQTDKTLSRRKALARLGGAAFAAYTVPAFTTLSVAHAASAASAAFVASAATAPSPASAPRAASDPTAPTAPAGPTVASAPTVASGPSRPGNVITASDCESNGGEIVDNLINGTRRCFGL